MAVTSAALGRGKTAGNECVSPDPCELTDRKCLGKEGHKILTWRVYLEAQEQIGRTRAGSVP